MKITENFRKKEFERSATADAYDINNSIPDNLLPNIKELCEKVLQPIHDLVGKIVEHENYYIRITSGFRSKELNKKVGGSPTSFHALAMAADCELYIKGEEHNALLYHLIKARGVFTELIWEYHEEHVNPTDDQPAWVHVAYNKNDNRSMLKYIN